MIRCRHLVMSSLLSAYDFYQIVKTATEKPTGDAERLLLYETALQVEDEITKKSGIITLDDGVINSEDSDNDTNPVRSGSDKDIEVFESKQKKGADKKKAKGKSEKKSLVKSYHLTDPLETKQCTHTNPATTQAANALASIGSHFNPDQVCGRDETQMVQTLQFSQLQSAQAEIRDLHFHCNNLMQQLHTETRHADNAEWDLRMFEVIQAQTSQHRRRSSSSSSRRYSRNCRPCRYSHSCSCSHSCSHTHHNQCSHSHSHQSHSRYPTYPGSPSHSQNAGMPTPSSSSHTLNNEGTMLLVTPKRNRDGNIESYKLSPAK